MSWTTEITVQNNTPKKYLCKIKKGQVFENKRIGTGLQNVASLHDYSFEVMPNATGVFTIEVLCLNQRLSSPNGQLNVTNYSVNKNFISQSDLWSIMQK